MREFNPEHSGSLSGRIFLDDRKISRGQGIGYAKFKACCPAIIYTLKIIQTLTLNFKL